MLLHSGARSGWESDRPGASAAWKHLLKDGPRHPESQGVVSPDRKAALCKAADCAATRPTAASSKASSSKGHQSPSSCATAPIEELGEQGAETEPGGPNAPKVLESTPGILGSIPAAGACQGSGRTIRNRSGLQQLCRGVGQVCGPEAQQNTRLKDYQPSLTHRDGIKHSPGNKKRLAKWTAHEQRQLPKLAFVFAW